MFVGITRCYGVPGDAASIELIVGHLKMLQMPNPY